MRAGCGAKTAEGKKNEGLSNNSVDCIRLAGYNLHKGNVHEATMVRVAGARIY
jgi:hypothetical protein